MTYGNHGQDSDYLELDSRLMVVAQVLDDLIASDATG